MDIKEFKQEILTHYLDENDLVKPRIDQGSKNGLMYAGLFYTILAENNEVTIQSQSLDKSFDSTRFALALNACLRVIKEIDGKKEKVNGLLFRSPTDNDGEGHDDYIGVTSACYHFRFEWPKAMVEYGKEHNWIFNNTKPYDKSELKFWHDRFPGLTTFYRVAAKERVGAWELLPLIMALLFNAFSKPLNEDSRMLTYMQLTVLSKEKPFPFWIIRRLWFFIINRRFGSLGGSWVTYFGKEHPFCNIALW